MKWSWKFVRIAGIDIYIHATFLLLLYWIGASYWSAFHTVEAVISGVGFVVAIFTCVVLHELGHSLTARRYGIQTEKITLLPIGGVASLEKMPDDPRQEINVALAGPAVNFVIASLIYLYLNFSQGMPTSEEQLSITGGDFLARLMAINLFIGLFNLLPAFPMDGGRVLRAALALKMSHAEATRLAASIGRSMAIAMGLVGLLYNPFLLFIAVFIWFGAGMESGAETLKTLLSDARVKHAMLTEFHSLSPDDKLSRAVELTLAGSQKDFPVGYHNKLYKVLRHEDLIQGLQQRGQQALIRDLPLHDIQHVNANESLETVLRRMQGNPHQLVCVEDGERVVGLVNLENILELIRIQDALRNRQN